MLIVSACREPWRPKPVEIETPKADSIIVVDTDSTRLNFVALKKEKYYFIGVRSDSTVLRRVRDTAMLDSLVADAKSSKRNVIIYNEAAGTYPEFKELIDALKRKELYRFRLIVDDKLNELRVEN